MTFIQKRPCEGHTCSLLDTCSSSDILLLNMTIHIHIHITVNSVKQIDFSFHFQNDTRRGEEHLPYPISQLQPRARETNDPPLCRSPRL